MGIQSNDFQTIALLGLTGSPRSRGRHRAKFEVDFGLNVLPKEPGIILIRGARQYGKSTWLEQQVVATILEFGPASAYYLNGDYLLTPERLEEAILNLLPAFARQAAVKRIFIDEITAIDRWELALKRLADQGKLMDILIITTGSKAWTPS